MRFLLTLMTVTFAFQTAAATTTKTKIKKSNAAKITKPDSDLAAAPARTTSRVSDVSPRAGNPLFGGYDVHVTPTLGVTMNSISGMEDFLKNAGAHDYSTSPDSGFSVGALADFGLGLPLTVFETGLAYSQLNQKFTADKTDYTYVMNYLSIPLQGKTYLQGSRSGLYMHYGLVANYLLGATFKNDNNQNVQDKMSSLNMMGALGVGYVTPINPQYMALVDLSLGRSLTKINSEGDQSLYNNTFLLNVGVQL